jgi:flagella basal body P-ring formation protein FlgA
MTRRVVLAKRGINQDAAIQPVDVELAPLLFTRLDKLGMGDVSQVIGQRAKRYLTAGSMIDPTLLESVPLVTRGQIVTVTAVSGAVQVVTTGKAMRDGLLGETVTVRASDREKLEFEAVVVGPGAVRIGDGPARPVEPPAAAGDGERVVWRNGA